MKLLIEIPDDTYERIQNDEYCGILNIDMYNAIKYAVRCEDVVSRKAVIDLIMNDIVNKGYGDPVARMVCNKIANGMV